MKPYVTLLVFVGCCVATLFAGYGSYRHAAAMVEADLNRALARTLALKADALACGDTVRACRLLAATTDGMPAVALPDATLRRHLTIPALRERAYIALSLDVADRNTAPLPAATAALHSDTFYVSTSTDAAGRATLAVRSYADCPPALIWHLSDQRPALVLAVLSLLWLTTGVICRRRRLAVAVAAAPFADAAPPVCFGGLRFDSAAGRFFDANGAHLSLTPMQQRLLEMFFTAPGHRLDKAAICAALWPGKPDAGETLYTLVHRLKQAIEPATGLRIEAERGRAYVIKDS